MNLGTRDYRDGTIRILVIVILTFLAYSPAWHGGFVWDDRHHLYDNSTTISPDGWYRFWFTTYVPLTMDLFWIEWRLFGMNPTGYHLINIALHALGAILAWRVLQRLRVPGAWFTGLIFALHPLNVTSAAWISEAKNTLALPFALAALLAFLQADELAQSAARRSSHWRYGLAVLLFLCTLLSKTAFVLLPVVMLLCTWYRRGQISASALNWTAAMCVFAAVLGVMTIIYQSGDAVSDLPPDRTSMATRAAFASWAAAFYLAKTLCPVRLLMIYPLWEGAPSWIGHLPILAWLVTLGLFWVLRDQVGRGFFLALSSFLVMILPSLGLIPMSIHRYQRVADHLAYPGILAILALVVATLAHTPRRLPAWNSIRPAVGVLVILGLFLLTAQRAEAFQDGPTLWQRDLAIWSESWAARNELGFAYAELAMDAERKRDIERAADLYRLARDQFREVNARRWSYLGAHLNLGNSQSALMRLEAARGDAATAQGYFNEAVASYHRALAIAPDYLDARLNLSTTYIDMHRYGDAVRELRIVEAAKPDAWAVQYRLASALIQEGVRLLNVSSAADPGARERAGTAFIEAVDRLRRAASMSPNNREVQYQLDLANTMLARYRQALPEVDDLTGRVGAR